MYKILLLLAFLLAEPLPANAQTPTLPPNTVLGRTGITPGPAQAIPFTTLGPLIIPTGNPLSAIKVAVRTATSTTDSITANDYFVCAANTTTAATENLPASPLTGLTFLIKDCAGTAGAHSITVVPATGNIDGLATFVMGTNFQSAAFTYNGTQWSVN